MNELREKLKSHLPYEEAKAIKKKLRKYAKENYKQRHTDTECINFMQRHEVSIDEVHPQSTNFPYCYYMFTVLTQHIYADSIRELLDIALDKEVTHSK